KNSDRLRQRLDGLYPSETLSGSREFQASSTKRTFRIAVSGVKGGSGGRFSGLIVSMIDLLQLRAPFGSAVYSKEEFCAEMGAAYPCAEAGISTTVIENRAAYVAGCSGSFAMIPSF